jgi:hypothetical protein
VSDAPRSDKSLPSLGTELLDLVRAYAKQETIEPIKGLGRFLAFGVVGSVLIGTGAVLVALSLLRVLQTETGDTFADDWSWVPYLLTLVLCLAVIGLAVLGTRRRKVA